MPARRRCWSRRIGACAARSRGCSRSSRRAIPIAAPGSSRSRTPPVSTAALRSRGELPGPGHRDLCRRYAGRARSDLPARADRVRRRLAREPRRPESDRADQARRGHSARPATSGTSPKSMPRWASRMAPREVTDAGDVRRARRRLAQGRQRSAGRWPRPRARRSPHSGAGSSARWPHSNPISCRFGWNAARAMREPSFWWREAGLASSLLAPVAMVYGAVAGAASRGRGRRAGVPVVCAGNLTVGGGGKTPTALAVARMLAQAGERPIFLSRGYGGRLAGPVRVDPARHRALDVGDEPLLLARVAPTIVARDRVAGARMAVAGGGERHRHGRRFSESFRLPRTFRCSSSMAGAASAMAGSSLPVRCGRRSRAQLARAHALVVVGMSPAAAGVIADARARGHAGLARPPASGRRRLRATLGGRARAGLCRHRAIRRNSLPLWPRPGSRSAQRAAFPTITATRRGEAQALCDEADRKGLVLVTTEKDLARLTGDDRLAQLAARAHALAVTLAFENEQEFKSLVLERIAAARAMTQSGRRRGTQSRRLPPC